MRRGEPSCVSWASWVGEAGARPPPGTLSLTLTSASQARNSSCFVYMSPSRMIPYLPHPLPDAVATSLLRSFSRLSFFDLCFFSFFSLCFFSFSATGRGRGR